ncbi:MAG: hypothetical protein SPD90_12260, partial [Intestinibacter sp.]
KSLVYNFYEEVNIFSSKIDENLTFKENCYILFDFFTNRIITISPYFQLLSSNFKIKDFCDYLKNDSILDNLKNDLYSITTKIISIGVTEGIIKEDDNKDYQRFVMISACSGIANSFCENKSTDLEICKSYAYEFIKRALK